MNTANRTDQLFFINFFIAGMEVSMQGGHEEVSRKKETEQFAGAHVQLHICSKNKLLCRHLSVWFGDIVKI